MTRLRQLIHRLRDPRQARREGSATLQTVLVIVPVTLMAVLVVQIFMVFEHAILVNHALTLAAQDAAARGGVDNVAIQTFQSHLPKDIQTECQQGTPCLTSSAQCASVISAGAECTSNQQTIKLIAQYDEDFSILKALGVNVDQRMTRSLTVTSQSLKDS